MISYGRLGGIFGIQVFSLTLATRLVFNYHDSFIILFMRVKHEPITTFNNCGSKPRLPHSFSPS